MLLALDTSQGQSGTFDLQIRILMATGAAEDAAELLPLQKEYSRETLGKLGP